MDQRLAAIAHDPQAALDDFRRLSDAETQALQRTPDETSAELVAAFMRFYIAQLKRLGKNEEVVQAMRRMIDLQKDDTTAIAQLAEWFLDQKAWEPLEELVKKFAPRFAADPILLYLYAEAKMAQNNAPKAKQLAAQALKLNPGKESVPQHYVVADYLRRRGCIAWSIDEFEYVIDRTGDQDSIGTRPVLELAELYFDQGKNLEAGKAIEKFLKKPSARRFFAPGFTQDESTKQMRVGHVLLLRLPLGRPGRPQTTARQYG